MTSWEVFFYTVQIFYMLYFFGLYMTYLLLNFMAVVGVFKYMNVSILDDIPKIDSDLEIPVSLLVPAYNEELTIVETVSSLLQLAYSKFEIIIINDGSADQTLALLLQEFDMVEFPEAYRDRLKTKHVRGIYISRRFRNVKVIDKENGGKADSLNAGINCTRFPLFCAVDADSILNVDSLERIIKPFYDDHTVIASGGTVRIANGCDIDRGYVTKVAMPGSLLPIIQLVEYLRAFLFGRLGWVPLNALMVISGAFGVFKKEVVVDIGGYLSDTIGEDMELVVRMHRVMRQKGRPYRISFIPDPVCWTEAPEDLASLGSQRVRWQRGLCESLSKNLSLLLHPRGGTVGWIAFPYMIIFEWIGPFIELFGLFVLALGFWLDLLSWNAMLLVMSVAIGFGVLLSTVAILLEEMSFHVYKKPWYPLVLMGAAIIENIGYRQLNSYWRIKGSLLWLFGAKQSWGKITRKAAWKVD